MRFVALIAALGGCAASEPFQERLLATLADDVRVNVPVAFSADGRRAAWVERRGDSCRAVRGDRAGKPYGSLC